MQPGFKGFPATVRFPHSLPFHNTEQDLCCWLERVFSPCNSLQTLIECLPEAYYKQSKPLAAAGAGCPYLPKASWIQDSAVEQAEKPAQ